MVAVRMRSTRKLRSWIIEQVSSGKYPGVMWDDEAKTMFRLPWKHAGKQDFRKDEDAAIFKAWAEFKGKLTDGGEDNPAGWKTRLRCALNKSPEFKEVPERAQLDISEPYKVYRLVPISEQGLVMPEKKSKEKGSRKVKRRGSDSQSNSSQVKQIKTEEVPPPQLEAELLLQSPIPSEMEEPPQSSTILQTDGGSSHPGRIVPDVPHHNRFGVSAALGEIQLDVRIEESISTPDPGQDSFVVAVQFLGQEVVRRQIHGSDVRILYQPSSALPPTPAALNKGFPRILLPEPPSTLPAGQQRQALFTLLPFMERGVVLTSLPQGVYGKRFCQGRVFWTGPHGSEAGLQRMERNTDPVLLFSKDAFRQQLENFRSNGGELPQCSFTLCFGEELSHTDDPSTKLITAKVSIPWAEEQVQNALSLFQSISVLQTLASQSPLGEITLNLVSVPAAAQELSTLPSI